MLFKFLMICLVFAMNVGYCKTEGNMQSIINFTSSVS